MLTKQSEMQSQVILISSLNKGVLNSYLFSYYIHLSFGSNYILTLLIELPKLYQIFSCKRSNEVKNYWDEGLCVGWKTN